MYKDLDDILEYIEKRYTPVQLVKVLDLDIGDLIVSLEDHIAENREVFEMEMIGLADKDSLED